MTHQPPNAIEFAKAEEQLRQEREAFDLQKLQSGRWFLLRLIVGYSSVLALLIIVIFCVYILMNSNKFPSTAVTAASAALFGDIIALFGTIWKLVLSPGTMPTLGAVTKSSARQRNTPTIP